MPRIHGLYGHILSDPRRAAHVRELHALYRAQGDPGLAEYCAETLRVGSLGTPAFGLPAVVARHIDTHGLRPAAPGPPPRRRGKDRCPRRPRG